MDTSEGLELLSPAMRTFGPNRHSFYPDKRTVDSVLRLPFEHPSVRSNRPCATPAFKVFIVGIVLLLFPGAVRGQRSEDLDFLSGLPDFTRVHGMLPNYLKRIATAQLEARKRQMAKISTPEDAHRRQRYFRGKMLEDLGGLPERTPLNARTVGILKRDGYRIERVIFESQPRFFVTANLYLPTGGQPPYPAVLFPLGHERGGKSNATWQQILVTMVKRGYVCLDWDPIGQGERVQIYDDDFESPKLGDSTTEHTMLGAECLLVGDALARYTIWDGMRALDYLLSRREVDSKRVACTGNSGGGTHTAYLSALDDRIQVAAPSCYLTSWARLLDSIGPQDAEQCIPGWLRDGLDHPDFVESFAPKPYLILSAIRDFFSISGARETYAEARRFYAVFGAEQKLAQFEADDGHGYSHPRRQAAYRWLGRWLKGSDDIEPEDPVQAEPEETLRCTESGQVAASLGGETVSSLILKRARQVMPAPQPLATPQEVASNRERLSREIRRLTGYDPPPGPLVVTTYGQLEKQNCRVEKLTYESEPGIIVPSLLFIPKSGKARNPAIIYVHEGGKAAGAEPGGDIEQLIAKNFVVLAIDARGTGETCPLPNEAQSNDVYRFFGDYDSAMTSLLVGKTFVGMRGTDISRGVELLAGRPEVDPGKIFGFGVGSGALTLLHTAVIDDHIRGLFLAKMLESYYSVVTHKLHRNVFESVVPGALKAYDLPDLVAALAPRPVWISDAVDPVGKRVGATEIQTVYARASEAFRAMNANSSFHIVLTRPDEKLGDVFNSARDDSP